MTWLALCLVRGHGVTADTSRAAGLFEQAGQRGAHLAQYWRGRVLYFGIGTERDFSAAVHWLQLAAAHGQSSAHDLLARCHFLAAVSPKTTLRRPATGARPRSTALSAQASVWGCVCMPVKACRRMPPRR
jgi:TPR repeat protein